MFLLIHLKGVVAISFIAKIFNKDDKKSDLSNHDTLRINVNSKAKDNYLTGSAEELAEELDVPVPQDIEPVDDDGLSLPDDVHLEDLPDLDKIKIPDVPQFNDQVVENVENDFPDFENEDTPEEEPVHAFEFEEPEELLKPEHKSAQVSASEDDITVMKTKLTKLSNEVKSLRPKRMESLFNNSKKEFDKLKKETKEVTKLKRELEKLGKKTEKTVKDWSKKYDAKADKILFEHKANKDKIYFMDKKIVLLGKKDKELVGSVEKRFNAYKKDVDNQISNYVQNKVFVKDSEALHGDISELRKNDDDFREDLESLKQMVAQLTSNLKQFVSADMAVKKQIEAISKKIDQNRDVLAKYSQKADNTAKELDRLSAKVYLMKTNSKKK